MKDKLFNDILSYLVSSDVTVLPTEVSIVKRLVCVLRDIFWHIDRNHYVFEQRAHPIPSVYSIFTNYNIPERSKHRKRLTSNISSDALQDFALELSTILNFSFWNRTGWVELKCNFDSLLFSVVSYCDYLAQKNKKAKINHRSPTPVRDISEHLQLKYIPQSSEELPANLAVINSLITGKDYYEATYISTHLPSNCVQKHRIVNSIISDGCCSSIPCMLLVYSPGSNIGNLHFLWKVPPNAEIAECFECSQPVIEQTKKTFPVFHSRAMRDAFFKKAGLISINVKPTMLRYFYKDLTGQLFSCMHLDRSLFSGFHPVAQ